MNRAEIVEKAANAIYDNPALTTDLRSCREDARRVLDAILPEVTTVDELEALRIDHDSLLVNATGESRRAGNVDEHDFKRGPLTVVWQPEVTA